MTRQRRNAAPRRQELAAFVASDAAQGAAIRRTFTATIEAMTGLGALAMREPVVRRSRASQFPVV